MSPDKINAIASCVSALCAVLALIGLIFYVRYTKQMKESADATYRASIEPLLVPDVGPRSFEDFVDQKHFKLRLVNEGNGPALQTSFLQLNDDESLANFGTFNEFPGGVGRDAIETLRPNQSGDDFREIELIRPTVGKSTLVILTYRDSANTWHQCQVKYEQTTQMEWLTSIVYCQKASKFSISRYSYPKKQLK